MYTAQEARLIPRIITVAKLTRGLVRRLMGYRPLAGVNHQLSGFRKNSGRFD
jgi:hypothetical protein